MEIRDADTKTTMELMGFAVLRVTDFSDEVNTAYYLFSVIF